MSDLDDLVERLKTMRDEIRVQVHLASKDLQDEWEELEETTEHFIAQSGLDKTGEGIGRALSELGNEIKLGYERIRDSISKD